MAQIIMKNRPLKAGMYWMQIPLSKRTRVQDLRDLMKNFVLPHSKEVAAGFPALPDGKGGFRVITGDEALQVVSQKEQGLSISPTAAAIGEIGSGVAIAVGFYLFIKTDIPLPSTLLGDPATTIFNENGQIIKESDAYGNVWTPQMEEPEMSGFGAFPPSSQIFISAPGQVIPFYDDAGSGLSGFGAFPVLLGLASLLSAIGTILVAVWQILWAGALVAATIYVVPKLIKAGKFLYNKAKPYLPGTPTGLVQTPGAAGTPPWWIWPTGAFLVFLAYRRVVKAR